MKHLLILSALLISGAATARAQSDTLEIEQPQNVKVITSTGELTVVVTGKQGDPNYSYSNTLQANPNNFILGSGIDPETWQFRVGPVHINRPRKARHSIESRFAFGWDTAPKSPAQMEVLPFKSWELWWIVCDQCFRPWNNGHMFSVGIGLDWRNSRMKEDVRFNKRDGQILLENYAEGARPGYSRVKVFSLNFPIRYQFRARHAGFSVGPVINFNLHSSLRTKYKLDGRKHIEKNSNAYVTPVTVDLMATVRVCGIDAYMKYSPCDVLRTARAPRFQSLSFGFML